MSWVEIKELAEQRADKLKACKAILDTAAADNKRDLTAEESAKFDALSAEAEAFTPRIDRLQRMYTTQQAADSFRDPAAGAKPDIRQTAGATVQTATVDQKAAEHRKLFVRYLRGEVGQDSPELRSLVVTGMGVVGDRPFYNTLVESMKWFGGVRLAGCTVLPTATGNPLTIPTADDTANTARQVAEAGDGNNDTDATLGTLQLDAYKFDSDWLKVSVEMLTDNEFGLEAHISKWAGERIGRKFNTAATLGTGSSQIKGVVVASSLGVTAASTSAITGDELIDLQHSIDPAYRQMGNCRYMFNDLTLASLRKLKDGQGQYLWAQGLNGTTADRIVGEQYVVNNDMALLTAGASSKVVLYGDFSKYFVRDVAAPYVVQARELFIGTGLIGYKIFSRHDGDLTDTAAVKHLKLHA